MRPRTVEDLQAQGLVILGKQPSTAAQVKALAELPPLPVMRAKLLGTMLAPASQLVRTLAEPARRWLLSSKPIRKKKRARRCLA